MRVCGGIFPIIITITRITHQIYAPAPIARALSEDTLSNINQVACLVVEGIVNHILLR